MRPRTLAAFVAISIPMGGCATPYMAAKAAEKRSIEQAEESLAGERYVAIGSSFAAGPMLPPPKPGAPARCGQSLNNYPTLVAERFGMVLVDRSCSGAKTDHVLGPWGDIPAQIASVDASTRLVTVTIGGNDLSYIGNLFSATCQYRAAQAPAGTKLKPCAPVRVPEEADYARTEAQLLKIAQTVREKAPKARLVLVQYLTPLPAPGVSCPATPVSARDAEIVRSIGTRLAQITDRVGQQTGALVVEMNINSAAHTPCDAEPWMIGAPAGYDGSQGLQWHLNLAGMKQTANDISWWLTRSGVKPVKPMVEFDPPLGETTPSAAQDEAWTAEPAPEASAADKPAEQPATPAPSPTAEPEAGPAPQPPGLPG